MVGLREAEGVLADTEEEKLLCCTPARVVAFTAELIGRKLEGVAAFCLTDSPARWAKVFRLGVGSGTGES